MGGALKSTAVDLDGNIHSQWYGMVRKRDDEIFDLIKGESSVIRKDD